MLVFKGRGGENGRSFRSCQGGYSGLGTTSSIEARFDGSKRAFVGDAHMVLYVGEVVAFDDAQGLKRTSPRDAACVSGPPRLRRFSQSGEYRHILARESAFNEWNHSKSF